MKAWSRREVLAYLERVERASSDLDHFRLLDVSTRATGEQIQSAFHRVAGGIHPDRHRAQLSPEQRERLTVVYARIAEAYRVLRDPEARERYLRQLTARGEAGEGAAALDPVAILSPRAQRLYGRAMASLRTGDRTSAVLNLKMALRLHPTSEVLREALRVAAGSEK